MNQPHHFLTCHHGGQGGGFTGIDHRGNNIGLFEYMAEEKRDALRSHAAFDPTATKGFGQIQQVLHHHVFGKPLGFDITVVNKQVTQLRKIIANGVHTVMTK